MKEISDQISGKNEQSQKYCKNVQFRTALLSTSQNSLSKYNCSVEEDPRDSYLQKQIYKDRIARRVKLGLNKPQSKKKQHMPGFRRPNKPIARFQRARARWSPSEHHLGILEITVWISFSRIIEFRPTFCKL